MVFKIKFEIGGLLIQFAFLNVDVTIKNIKCRKINNVEKYFFEKKLKQKHLGKKVR